MDITATPAKQRLKRFIREPHKLPTDQLRNLTEKSLAILSAVLDYRFLSSSLIVSLAGEEKNTYRHLQHLFHTGYLNRFAFPLRTSEFVYYIDTQNTLQLLIDRGLASPTDEERDEYKAVIRHNRENEYHQLHRNPDSHGRPIFINHEMKISRFHTALELACRQFPGKVELATWIQGAPLYNRVEVPKVIKDPHDHNVWIPSRTETTKLPHRPDALFTLRFPTQPEDRQLSHFFYEADRKTESSTDYRLKLRAHYHFCANVENRPKPLTQVYGTKYGINTIRAVLTETEDQRWCDYLRQAAGHSIVSPKPSPLFWFLPSTTLTSPTLNAKGKPVPAFLHNPKLILQRLWKTPVSDTGLSLLD